MRWNRRYVALGLLPVALAAVGLWIVTYSPAFYRAAVATSSAGDIEEQSRRFVQTAVQLIDAIRLEDRWSQQFSDVSVNAWLSRDLPVRYAAWLPAGVEQPRVAFRNDILQLAFRARRGLFSGVISAELQIWVAGPNQLACEIRRLRLGLLPVPAEDLLSGLVDDLNKAGWRVEWKQSDGADVLLVSLDSDAIASEHEGHPVVEAVELAPGKLRVAGARRSGDGQPAPRAAVSHTEDPAVRRSK